MATMRFGLRQAEEEMLHAAGFSVKNTFIDEPAQSVHVPRRATSAPPLLVRDPSQRRGWSLGAGQLVDSDLRLSPGEEERAGLVGQCGGGQHAGPSSSSAGDASLNEDAWPCNVDDTKEACLETETAPASTCCDSSSNLTCDTSELTWSDATDTEIASSDASSVCDEESVFKLPALIKRECGFLRIASCSLQSLDEKERKRLPLKSVTHCLRVCVEGLPPLKRNKWLQPLVWSASTVLQRVGCAAIVKRGELFAPLDGASSEILVRVDLCAPRSPVAAVF